jgi:alcohol dehydrogenase
VRGQWMYDTAAIPGLVGLVRGGLLDLGHWAVTTFPLTGANDAVAHAAANAGPFKLTVLKP